MAQDVESCAICEGKKEILIDECFTKYCSYSECNRFIDVKSKYDKGIMPKSGGELDQYWRLLLYFGLFDQYILAWNRLWPEE